MKKLIAALALTAVIASPALAASSARQVRAQSNANANAQVDAPNYANAPTNAYGRYGRTNDANSDLNVSTSIGQKDSSGQGGM